MIEAHKDLEKMVLTKHELRFKQLVDETMGVGGLFWLMAGSSENRFGQIQAEHTISS